MKNFLFLIFILFAQFLDFESKPYNVIIIGAGASGIAAAKKLNEQGPNNFNIKILEARDRIGGRISTDFKSFGYPIDLGAIHITSQNDNPILKNAHKTNIKLVYLDRSNSLMYTENNKILKNGLEMFSQLAYRLLDFIKKNYVIYKNYPVKYAVSQFIEKNKFSPLEKLMVKSESYSYNLSLKRPLNDLKEYIFAGASSFGDECFMTPDGYVKTLEPEVWNFYDKIQFNTVITSISQESQEKKSKIKSNKDKVILTDQKGNKYTSDYVIVTVPLGYLKKNLINFSPELSVEKKEAIEKLAVFNMNKIFIEFEEKFWPNSYYFTLFTLNGPFIFDRAVNMHKIYKNRNLILLLISEDKYDELKNYSNAEIQKMILDSMALTFPQHKDKMKITKFLFTNWIDEPFTYGSFSEPGGHEYLRRRFEEPEGRIIFAGEHTHQKYNAYVYGAYLTGLRAADQIIEFTSNIK